MNDYKDKALKFQSHGSGQDKHLVTFSKFHDTIIFKIRAIYDNGIDVANSTRASEIVDTDGVGSERKISEETYVKKEDIEQRSFDIR